jgi:hypothetical protein
MNTIHRSAMVAATALLAGSALTATSASAGTEQIGGDGAFVGAEVCSGPPAGFEAFTDYPPIALTGSLEGCWYTDVQWSKDLGAPSGVYLETGREVFVGSINDGPVGTFTTTYRFESKWTPDLSGSEVVGRCQHPIVAGSGTGGFAGVTGRVDFKDDVATGCFLYRGHLTLP